MFEQLKLRGTFGEPTMRLWAALLLSLLVAPISALAQTALGLCRKVLSYRDCQGSDRR
jgi:ABC-type spermidine/putrescine transport system permease subunit II